MANLGMQTSDWRSDGSLAYSLFRFTFGLNIMMRGVVRIAMGLPAFQNYMLTQFKDVPVMPSAFLIPFATVLPFVETLIGLCILLGFQTRAALIAGALMIAGLTFGTMLRQDFTIAWLQLDYAIAFFLLIALRSWNLISVDAMMGGGKASTAVPARV
ncbi:MAG: DoxX family membrane protein [Betaproteobacteria bacterium]|nr:MAG: DoxX family membrane protein [Betaproteobacteria bacterium]